MRWHRSGLEELEADLLRREYVCMIGCGAERSADPVVVFQEETGNTEPVSPAQLTWAESIACRFLIEREGERKRES